ncbi:MAG: serine/threonine-protein kinase PknK [Proteobacteria bacterium]|nr:serine/threonine-protein kinase PknK [Pseudomonadota bacterium]
MNLAIPGFQLKEQLFKSEQTLIYRALREIDQTFVIIKTINNTSPSILDISRFKHEYHITQKMKGTVVVRAFEQIDSGGIPALVLEDFQGISLNDYLDQSNKFGLKQFLSSALEIGRGLGYIHHQNVIHKDINPNNILFNPITNDVQIIDFGISTELSRELQDVNVSNQLDGSLAYISPEQTGRMNRDLDYRTDYYSLGVTLYEMLTGSLPFKANDTIGWVHSHIAQTPVPPHKLDPSIPEPVSNIVLKLMAKNAENRYQSFSGLRWDLKECLQQLEQKGQIRDFKLGCWDISEKFRIPQQLLGREDDLAMLLRTFDQVALGSVECVLVSGYAGIGKSALVQELCKTITARCSYFIRGKFDQQQGDIPYVALSQAFGQLMRQLLTESEERLQTWKQELSTVLGGNGQLLIDLIPALEWIIGPQPAVKELDGEEAQNRLHHLLQNFVKLFGRAECPLVIFIDDLQWADSGSLKLLEMLLTSFELKHLLFIGAYRDNEVSGAHTLIPVVRRLEEAQVKVKWISLRPLSEVDIGRLLAATLHQSETCVQALAHLVFKKTGGNPYFTLEFLKSLREDGLLTFTSPRADGKEGGWQWELSQIDARSKSDNVVNLMVTKVKQLPQQTQLALQLASCIGSQFALQTLTLVSDKTAQAVAADLNEALQVGLIIPMDDDYKYIATLDEAAHMKIKYKFAHDRVQQAAYTLIEPAKRQAIHWQMGQLLLAQIPHDQQDEHIFDIVNHLNQSSSLVEDEADRRRLIDLNLKAGRRALETTAYGSALAYLEVGLTLLPENSWKTEYELTLTLHTLATEAAYLHGKFERMEQFTETVLKQAQTKLDQAKIYEISTDFHLSQGRLSKAVQTALHAVNLLIGLNIPIQPAQHDVEEAMQEVQATLAHLGPTLEIQLERLLDHAEMTDPKILVVQNILVKGTGAAFQHNAELNFVMLVAGIKLTIKYGLGPVIPMVFSYYANYLCAQGDVETGYRIGQFVLRLGEQRDTFAPAIARCNIDGLVRPWKEHIRHTLASLLADYQPLIESGQTYRACLSVSMYCNRSLLVGKNLVQVEQDMARYCSTLKQLKQFRVLGTLQLYWQFVLNVCGKDRIPWQLEGEQFDSKSKETRWLETRNINGSMTLYIYQCILSYLFERFPQAEQHARNAEPYMSLHTVGPYTPAFYLYDSLSRLAVFFDVSTSEQQQILARVSRQQEIMKQWATHAPMNFQHQYLLVEAELARVSGNDGQAREYYDQSIELAQKNEYINEEALAYNVAARFYLAKGNLKIAHLYLHEARSAYQLWGAIAKVEDLENRYPDVFVPTVSSSIQPHTAQSKHDSVDLTDKKQHNSSSTDTIDLEAVTKAAQAISGEMVLDKLLTKLMQTVREHAGAEKAILLLVEESNDKLLIQAKSISDNKIDVLTGEKIEDCDQLSQGIVN